MIHTPEKSADLLKRINEAVPAHFEDVSYKNDECDSIHCQEFDLQIYFPSKEGNSFYVKKSGEDEGKLFDSLESTIGYVRQTLIDRARKLLSDVGYFVDVLWSIEDVLGSAENMNIELSKEEAREVLTSIGNNHDANHGINWEAIETEIEDLFPEKFLEQDVRDELDSQGIEYSQEEIDEVVSKLTWVDRFFPEKIQAAINKVFPVMGDLDENGDVIK